MRTTPRPLLQALIILVAMASLSTVIHGKQSLGWPPNASNMWSLGFADVDAPSQSTVVIENIAPLSAKDYVIFEVPAGSPLVVTDALPGFSVPSFPTSQYDLALLEVRGDGTERMLDRRGFDFEDEGAFGWKEMAPLGKVLAPGSAMVLRVRNWSTTQSITQVRVGGHTLFAGYFSQPTLNPAKSPSWPPTSDRIIDLNRGDQSLPPFGLPLVSNLPPGQFADFDLMQVQGPLASKMVLTGFELSPGCGPPQQYCWFSFDLLLYERASGGEKRWLRQVHGPGEPGDYRFRVDGPVGPLLSQGSTLVMRIRNASSSSITLTAWDLQVSGYYATSQ